MCVERQEESFGVRFLPDRALNRKRVDRGAPSWSRQCDHRSSVFTAPVSHQSGRPAVPALPAMSDSDDDDVPTLSAHTLAALQDFYNESRSEPAYCITPSEQFTVGALEEDWRMSQFWYSDETAAQLAEEVVREAGEGGRIACVSAPSVYQKLKQGVVDGSDRVSAVVLEYDRRFAIYGDDFMFYDYNEPLCLAAGAAPQSFDIVLADPPYLSEECLSKVAKTIQYLSKGKVLLCTGAIMENLAKDLLDVKMCSFLPKHNKHLSNEFRCFANYPSRLLSC